MHAELFKFFPVFLQIFGMVRFLVLISIAAIEHIVFVFAKLMKRQQLHFVCSGFSERFGKMPGIFDRVVKAWNHRNSNMNIVSLVNSILHIFYNDLIKNAGSFFMLVRIPVLEVHIDPVDVFHDLCESFFLYKAGRFASRMQTVLMSGFQQVLGKPGLHQQLASGQGDAAVAFFIKHSVLFDDIQHFLYCVSFSFLFQSGCGTFPYTKAA